MSADPFRRLGLDRSATADDIRRARRELAKRSHPDIGGDATEMRSINDAAAAALRLISGGEPLGQAPRDADARAPFDGFTPPTGGAGSSAPGWEHGRRDAPSFTVEALPAETFEALLLAAAALGEVEDDDPPYGLDVLMGAPLGCWCRLAVVPDAGASTVSLTLVPEPERPLPAVELVRDAWIAELNSLDWSALG